MTSSSCCCWSTEGSFSCFQPRKPDLKYTNIAGNLPVDMSGLWNRSMFGFLQSRPTNTLTDYINIGPTREKAEAMLCDFQNMQPVCKHRRAGLEPWNGHVLPRGACWRRKSTVISRQNWRQKSLALLFFGTFSSQRLLAVLPLIPVTFLLQITCSASVSWPCLPT